MNEKMKQLAYQAGATVITTHGMEHVVDGCYVIGPARLEKFAELIVRECAKAAGDFEYARLHDSLVEDHVLKHFGVEE